jgi:tetratricopeptide (TPR) repeat protein
MMARIYKYFFYSFVSLLIIILIVLTFHSELRRQSFTYGINAYKLYMIISIQSDLKKDNLKLDSAEKKISKFIDSSNKIANGKSSLLIGIYDAINLIESSIINENDYGKFEKVLKRIVEIDPMLFNVRVSLAKSLFANGKKEEAIQEIKNAIELNPLDHKAYRLLIKMGLENFDKKMIQNVCNNYFNSNLGGKNRRYKNTIFTGFNNNKFAVQFNPSVKKKLSHDLYYVSGINLNKFELYEIIPSEVLSLENLNLLFNFIPGTTLEIKEIILYSGIKKFIIEEKNILITSRNSFFSNGKLSNIIFFSKYDNEIINLKLENDYKEIDKIQINMKVSKAGLTNKYCDN